MLKSSYTPEELNSLSSRELKELARDIREFLVETVSATGGHLSSNLGVVELTIALHAAFHSPEDKIIFDVGHQAYVHKILTGRKDAFSTLRQKDGISGFPRREESPHDAFSAGHSSTAISAALGYARANAIRGEKRAVVAVLGDGALTGGMSYEALNDAGQSETPIIVVLNDNEMSISRNVGALSGYLTHLRQSSPYRAVKRALRKGLTHVPVVGEPLLRGVTKVRDVIKEVFMNEHFFDALGFQYLGPINGHDTKWLIQILKSVKHNDRPVLLHVVTQKGRGYEPAESRPDDFHGAVPFYVETGKPIKPGAVSNGQAMADELIRMADKDPRVVAVTAAMPIGTGLNAFAVKHPKRLFDVGIAEEHAVTMAGGMAAGGLKPYVAIYSTFVQRAYDQMLIDVCLQSLPVTFLLDRAGLTGSDGATHQGVFDLSFLREMPNMVIAAPRDVRDLRRLMRLSLALDRPMAIRYARDAEDMGPGMEREEPLKIGEWEMIASGAQVMILAVGRMVELALQTSIELHGRDVQCGVIDARFIKPMDEEMLGEVAKRYPLIVTIEDNIRAGGFGSGVMEKLNEWGSGARLLAYAVPDRFIEHATVNEQMAECGLTVENIARGVLAALEGELSDARG